MGTTSKKLVLALLGPPGSGKGSYGRHLAKALHFSLIGMSDILREVHPSLDLSSGKLVEDAVVTHSLHDYIANHHKKVDTLGYVLDGFPRTIRQLEDSAGIVTIHAAIQLAVPDSVCETKLMGRRLCRKCGGNFNVHGVDREGWVLPPTLPTNPECSETQCNWETRSDDQPDVVHDRLKTYHEHVDRIVDCFKKNDKLLKLFPYHGFEDVPDMIAQLEVFLKERVQH